MKNDCLECGVPFDLNIDAKTGVRLAADEIDTSCIAVCINCGEIMIFTEAGTLRRTTLAERSACGPELEAAVTVIVQRGRIRTAAQYKNRKFVGSQ